MAVMALPEKYRKRLRTANMQERLNEEIRRRERVIHIFPNDESALRLIGTLLVAQSETCAGAKVSGHAGVSRMGGYLRRRRRGQQRCCPLLPKTNRH